MNLFSISISHGKICFLFWMNGPEDLWSKQANLRPKSNEDKKWKSKMLFKCENLFILIFHPHAWLSMVVCEQSRLRLSLKKNKQFLFRFCIICRETHLSHLVMLYSANRSLICCLFTKQLVERRESY